MTTEEFAERVFASALGAIEIYSIHIGDRLGFYRALAKVREMSAGQLAHETGVHERYAREWLEQQATYGILEVSLDEPDHRFSLPESHAQVLADESNSSYLAPMARMLTTAGQSMPLLLDAYLAGEGVSWDQFGPDMRESQADMNRPLFENDLAEVFAGLGRVHDSLSASDARVADVGCGAGWSTLSLARAYPAARFDGFDIDAPSIEMARRHAASAGLDDRVRFSTDDIAGSAGDGYDVALAFECIHDMARPIEVLSALRRMVGNDGVVIVMDEAVGDSFTGAGDEIEKLMYGFSILICLPDGLSSRPSAGTGTVMRPSTLRGYAEAAGFEGFRVVGETGFFRFYELT